MTVSKSLLNEETDIIDNFIDLQLNSIQIYLVSIKRLEKFAVLKSNYFKKSIRIAVFFISLQQLFKFNNKEVLKVQKESAEVCDF